MIPEKKLSKERLYYLLIAISKITQSNQRGFTIIESLIALLVVSILLAAIAPVITLAVATRVQSRQVELASQAARTYIDGVRTGKIDAPTSTGSDTLNAYTAPTTTGTLTCPTSTNPNAYCTAPTGTSLYCVNFDSTDGCQNSSLTDMVIQAFRYNPTSGSTAANGYSLGIRVYRADAFKLSTTLSRNNAGGNNEKVTQNSFTGGAGQRTSPLVEMITDINETVPKYNDLCDRLGGCNN